MPKHFYIRLPLIVLKLYSTLFDGFSTFLKDTWKTVPNAQANRFYFSAILSPQVTLQTYIGSFWWALCFQSQLPK